MARCAEREAELVVSGPGTGRDSADGLLCFLRSLFGAGFTEFRAQVQVGSDGSMTLRVKVLCGNCEEGQTPTHVTREP